MRKALTQYRINANNADSPGRILLRLYDGTIKFLKQARVAIDQNRPDKRGDRIRRAHAIISELNATLNHDVDPALCENLSALYRYMLNQLTEANQKNSAEPIDLVIELLEDLRGAWVQAVRETERAKTPASNPKVPVHHDSLSVAG